VQTTQYCTPSNSSQYFTSQTINSDIDSKLPFFLFSLIKSVAIIITRIEIKEEKIFRNKNSFFESELFFFLTANNYTDLRSTWSYATEPRRSCKKISQERRRYFANIRLSIIREFSCNSHIALRVIRNAV
jgi:hypothetical protein